MTDGEYLGPDRVAGFAYSTGHDGPVDTGCGRRLLVPVAADIDEPCGLGLLKRQPGSRCPDIDVGEGLLSADGGVA